MLDLIEKLEKAAGPDRDLDRDVALACGWKRKPWVSGAVWEPPTWKPGKPRRSAVPKFTASIDAALPLMPQGWHAILYTETRCAELYPTEIPKRPAGIQSRANGPRIAVAICIAALKARAADTRA